MSFLSLGKAPLGAPLSSKIIGGNASSPMKSNFEMQYGMTPEDAYDKLMGKANLNMNLGSNSGFDTNGFEDSLNNLNNIITEHNQSQADLLSGSDYFKEQMSIAERKGATSRTPAASALGGGTMSTAPLSSQTATLGKPMGAIDIQRNKANTGGK